MNFALFHKITAYILVFMLCFQNVNTLFIVGDFMVNQALIAKTLCVQKENQQGCNGKCQLRKELSENTQTSKPEAPAQDYKRLTLDVFYLSENLHDSQVFCLRSRKENIKLATPKLCKLYLDIDTPPPNFI
ncbi:hypothetical protein ESY86_11195 [Subsaximicrobium wynnwilliamsii]|uniref:Uncharacterized protein n=1 Tax=Subsaximicrobium wynnwilliamsii TaxID=291179 RepID=A0A5C6ZHN2_9FLAO|nr:hypothetical protein [Subsaximicrobium wynnwilliamsii]TXD83053.1 hypothetical protein ESY87_11230 [Subsaximicrobium wynnwilliamsii]TXD88797.1 hypothetical protein ESY86_11195 [Subsaximicrobium wynnwilliamsii]TXE02870.1 hypothetical protein ESY88_10250 [Subsaximicrobium wynnwilliamsii]